MAPDLGGSPPCNPPPAEEAVGCMSSVLGGFCGSEGLLKFRDYQEIMGDQMLLTTEPPSQAVPRPPLPTSEEAAPTISPSLGYSTRGLPAGTDSCVLP